MAFDNRRALWLAAGLLSGLGTAFCIAELRKFIREKCTRKPLSHLEDNIKLEDLEILVRSSNYSLRKSAEQVVLDKAMKNKNLDFIVNACFSDDEFQVLKAVVALAMLVKNSERNEREKLIEHKVLESLSHSLVQSVQVGYRRLVEMGGYDLRLQRCASESLFHLIYDEEATKLRLAQSNSSIFAVVLQLISEGRSKEVMRWSLFIVHQLASCDSLRPELLANGVIPAVSAMLVRNQGDFILMKTCLHTMVMFVNNTTESEIAHLKEMAKYDVFRTAVVSLRADDGDLVYWAAGLLHQFAIQDLYKAEICATPNIVKSLQNVLCSSEATLQRLILRLLSFLCVGSKSFRNSVLHCSSLVARLPVCLASGDTDIVHWSVVLLHDLVLSEGNPAANRAAALRVLSMATDVIKALVPLACRQDNILIRMVAELLGLFCTIENLQSRVLEDGCLKAVLAYSESTDTELQFWASALLLNMAMTSDGVKKEIIMLGGLKSLMELAIGDSDHPQCSAHAAKTLVMLGFLDTEIPVCIKSLGYKSGDRVSILINGKEHCPNKPGINIVVMDFTTFNVTEAAAFDTGHDKEASDHLVEFVDMIPIGTLVFIAVRGEADYYMTDKARLSLKDIGIEDYNFKTGELWTFCGYKRRDGAVQISLQRGFDVVELSTTLSLGYYSNEQVQGYILLPLIDLLMSTPASLAISKVSELELLTVLARHDHHKEVMVNSEGFMEYIVQLIYSMANKTADHLRANPLLIAHCIGAMKIITAISISQEIHDKFTEYNVLDCVLSLLSLINSIQLERLKQQLKTRTGRMGQTDILVIEAEDFSANEIVQPVEENAVSHVVNSPGGNFSSVPEEVKLTASGLRTPVHGPTTDEPASVKSGSPFYSTFEKKSNTKPLLTESVTGEAIIQDDLDEAFSTLTGLSVITLYNCIDLISSLEEFRRRLSKAETMRILWCRLLTASCGSSTIQQIELATEMLLNSCCCMTMLGKYTTELVVELDEQTKTPALVLSADRLEASNPNWTFESVHSTLCVGRGMSTVPPYPAGWYYEVTLKCTGILQIGWQTEECRYGPERGVGVGDDKNSCAFDGARCKVWSGPPSEQLNNDYGKEWSYGDVLSCLFSWNGEVSFWLNGVDMGVAFRGLNPGVNWYPAASIAMDQQCCFNFGGKPFRYEIPDGYIAVSHVVSNLVKKASLRLSSCWTPISGSFESIVEEDEEVIDDQELEASETKTDDTAPCDKEPSSVAMKEEQPSVLSLEHSVADSDVLFDYQDTSSVSECSLALSPEPTNHSLTFVTPPSGVFTTPQSSPPKVSGHDVFFLGSEPEPSPFEVVSTGDETVSEEKPPFEEKHVTSTPYLGVGPLRDSIGRHFEARSRLSSWPQVATPGESFIEPIVPCLYFEAELKFAPCRVKQMGFINVETREKIYCDVHDGHLQFPKSSSPTPHEQQSFRVPDVVGCAVVLSTGQIMFTLDGVATGQFYNFPSSKPSSMVIENLFPYISCTRIRCNYGQRSFLFGDANNKESLVMSGALLHGLAEENLRL